jgi:hypothetical protein
MRNFRQWHSFAIASEAKQSIQNAQPDDDGLLRRFAPRNDGGACIVKNSLLPDD